MTLGVWMYFWDETDWGAAPVAAAQRESIAPKYAMLRRHRALLNRKRTDDGTNDQFPEAAGRPATSET